MRKQKRQMCKKNVVFFSGVCINMCSIPSAAQAAVMRTAKNSTVQKKKTSTKTVTIETSGEIIKRK